MGALARFLLSLGNLIRSGGIKKIEEAIEFAKNEFGEVTPLLQKQIEKVFKTAKKPKTEKKAGDVVELKKEGVPTKLGTLDDMESTKFATDKEEGIASLLDEIKEIKKGFGEIKNETNLLPDSERLARGFPSRSVEAIVRTGARELLVKKGIEVGEQDPIQLARQIFGDEILEKLDNVADEMMTAQSFSDIGKILEREKIVDMQPRKGLDVSKSDELEQITKFDETDRKPNAEGGLNYLMGL